jgi:hypothetical protein
MNQIDFNTLNSIFSKSRLYPFFEEGDTAERVLEKYHVNIVLSEAMIPSLHYFEICFRNNMDRVIKKYYSENWLKKIPQNLIISGEDEHKINKIISKIKKEFRREPSHDDIVAQMTFGFWCSFFHRKYDPLIWHRKDALKIIFPHISRVQRTRSALESRIFIIKEVRNRIAHHEPVWIKNRRNLVIEGHRVCCELIRAMSEEAANMLTMIDNFDKIYAREIAELCK